MRPGGRRVYRTRVLQLSFAIAGVFFVTLFAGTMLTDGVDVFWTEPAATLVLVLLVTLFARGVRAGVYVDGDGLLIRNLFRSFRLNWDAIERFELGPYHLTPLMGHAVLRGGRKHPISGIVQTRFEGGGRDGDAGPASEAVTIINELNERLARERASERDVGASRIS